MLRPTKYNIQNHIEKSSSKVQIIFKDLSQKVSRIDNNFIHHPTKDYIAFAIRGKIISAIKFRKGYLVIELYRVQPQDLDDSRSSVKYVKFSFEDHNKHISYFDVKDESDIDYAVNLIKQVYSLTFKNSL